MQQDKMIERLTAMEKRLNEIDELLCKDEVISNIKMMTELNKERSNLEEPVESYKKYKKILSDIEDSKIMETDEDPEIAAFAKENLKELTKQQETLYEEMKLMLIPKDPNDNKNIICEIRGAAGGDEANIFAGDLFRMYTRYAESKGWKIQVLDSSESEMGGFASISFMIKGEGVYSRLKFESGAHRVQRVPKTEAAGRIHTSTATVLVMPEAEEVEVEINPADLQIDTYRSSGAGGQNVNKTESAVRITHIPTGIVVECQDERSQHKNKAKAMSVLASRLVQAEEERKAAEQADTRRSLLGSGDRSDKIRTYNYPQGRVTDHRINLTLYRLDEIMNGKIDDLIQPIITEYQAEQLAALSENE